MASTHQSAPYRPEVQSLGGTPTIPVDIPVCAVFMLLYIIAGVLHFGTFLRNKKVGKKFIFGGMMFGLCKIRIVTLSLRIAWACYPRNIRLGIAAQIFVNIGVVLLYFVNLFFTQRIVRAQHPNFGWSKLFTPLIPIICAITVLTIIALIVAVIQSFYTLDKNIHRIDRIIELYGPTAFSAIAFVPIVIITISTLLRLIPSVRGQKALDKFGSGKMSTKIAIVIPSAALLTLAASLKAGTSYLRQVPLLTPDNTPEPTPWYFNRGIFYGFGFGVEIIILFFYMAVRVDKRFIIPDGAKRPYSYAGGFVFAGESGNEKSRLVQRDSTRNLTGSSQSLQSWGGSTRRGGRSKAPSVISWGGISQADTEMGIGEDGVEPVPYVTTEDGEIARPASIAGAEQEMGWDSKSGKWKLRPVSGMSAVSTAIPMMPREDV
ncbi:hypothetical protein D6D21_08757 [Aureobasidium pullulans]|uniref:Uncharacterized protein n=1 Tax=Aureobasidium pullulans TaxID=5580 RepID=A0AB74IP96_AURPU|nr:hypothetical protein D6D21_08757 [Aureobasidium pullulans]